MIRSRHSIAALLAAPLLCLVVPRPAGAAPAVVATIKPVHALVAGVMEGAGEPALLVRGAGSPHAYSLRPSEARALQAAEVVFRVSPALETFLEGALASLAADARVVALAGAPGVRLLPARPAGLWEATPEQGDGEHAEDAAEEQHDHAHGAHDLHVWLDPRNAAAMVEAIAATLAGADPARAATYRANARRLQGRIAALEDELGARLAPVRERPYLVYHDAYRYLEARYGLHAAGAVTASPERAPGARRIAALREPLQRREVVCVFTEPQFRPRIVRTLVEGTGARVGVLDPLGAALPEGPALYFRLMRGLAEGLGECLASGG